MTVVRAARAFEVHGAAAVVVCGLRHDLQGAIVRISLDHHPHDDAPGREDYAR
jgi:hypothetical protein